MKLDVAGEEVELLADRAVLWPAGGAGSSRTVLVADVHLGKADTFRHFGLPLPDADLEVDLARLTALVRTTRAARLLVLGDLVHAAAGLTDEVEARVARWSADLDAQVDLVPGNHDRSALTGCGLPPRWGMQLLPDGHAEGPFRFAHEPSTPSPAASAFTWCGHLHPAVVVGRGRLGDRFPCFWIGAAQGVLPAFGSFTGGRAVRPTPGDRLVAVTSDGLVALPVSGP